MRLIAIFVIAAIVCLLLGYLIERRLLRRKRSAGSQDPS